MAAGTDSPAPDAGAHGTRPTAVAADSPRRDAVSRRARSSARVARRVAACALLVAVLAGCSAFTPQTPRPTPTDFAGIVEELAHDGVSVAHVVSGDAGCADERLARTAISFDASGLDQAAPTRVRLYSFKDAAVFTELRPAVDLCARTYVTDPAAYATAESSPYVFTGAGPWAPKFAAALRTALESIAGGG